MKMKIVMRVVGYSTLVVDVPEGTVPNVNVHVTDIVKNLDIENTEVVVIKPEFTGYEKLMARGAN